MMVNLHSYPYTIHISWRIAMSRVVSITSTVASSTTGWSIELTNRQCESYSTWLISSCLVRGLPIGRSWQKEGKERRTSRLFCFQTGCCIYLDPRLLVKKPARNPSSTPTLSDDEGDEPPTKRRATICIPHEAAQSKDAKHMPKIIGDRAHRSRCRNNKCSALTTVRCTDCKMFICFTASRNCFKLFHENKK